MVPGSSLHTVIDGVQRTLRTMAISETEIFSDDPASNLDRDYSFTILQANRWGEGF